jgi:hypothetical protein
MEWFVRILGSGLMGDSLEGLVRFEFRLVAMKIKCKFSWVGHAATEEYVSICAVCKYLRTICCEKFLVFEVHDPNNRRKNKSL